MAKPNNIVGVDNSFRRKFDKEEYLQRARERKENELKEQFKPKGPPVQRKPLKRRDYEVGLDSRLGKTQVVTIHGQQAGYWCAVCECVVKDSANYLDHINGKKHQRALGMSMRVERESLEQVKQRFENLENPRRFNEQDLDERILIQQQDEEERKRQKRERKKEKKKDKAEEEEVEVDPVVAAMMGFGGFGTSKK